MKPKMNKMISTLLISMVLLSITAAITPSVWARPNGMMYFDPASYTYDTDAMGYGDTFDVTVKIKNVTDLFAWQYKIYFNASVINCVQANYHTEEPIINHGSYMPTSPVIRNDLGASSYVMHAITSMESSGPSVPEGDPKGIAVIRFNVTMEPKKLQCVNSTLTFDSSLTKVEDSGGLKWTPAGSTGGVLTVNTGYYELCWAPPPSPYLKVEPPLVEKGVGGAPCIGETFCVTVMIMGLGAAWQVTNVTFDLTYDNSFLEVLSITPGTGSGEFYDTGLYTASYTGTDPGPPVHFTGEILTGYPPYPSGDLKVATICFNVTDQPTFPDPDYECDLELQNIELSDPDDVNIPSDPAEDGHVTVYAFIPIEPPVIAVDPQDTTLGPAWAVGTQFDIDIVIEDLSEYWYLVGVEFRLSYCPDLLDVVSVTEGPFLGQFTANKTGTFFVSFIEPDTIWGPHILVGALLLPNATGQWPPPYPEGTGVIATIRFEATYQLYPYTNCCALDFIHVKMIDKDGYILPYTERNGTYCITGEGLPGRMVDLYICDWPAPFGGQGLGQPSDMFWPQKKVELCALVTYNTWPVQSKLVDFVVYDNEGRKWTVLQGRTDANGIAHVQFRIPWPCEDPESLIGVWCVRASVDVACIVVEDTLCFHFDYLVNIVSITTDKWQYCHCETVEITVTFTSHRQRPLLVAMDVVIHDELDVPIGWVQVMLTIEGAEFCEAKEYTEVVEIHIPKFAFAGLATIHVNFRYNEGGKWTAAGPEGTANFFIMPC